MNGPYKIGTLSRLTGFSPLLLRAWERRFALLAPERGEGGQRLYTDDDLAVLRHVRALMDDGRSIGEIARSGRDALLATTAAGSSTTLGRAAAPSPTLAPAADRVNCIPAAGSRKNWIGALAGSSRRCLYQLCAPATNWAN